MNLNTMDVRKLNTSHFVNKYYIKRKKSSLFRNMVKNFFFFKLSFKMNLGIFLVNTSLKLITILTTSFTYS